MRFRYLSLGAVAIGIVLVGSASPAHADIPGGSGCSASGDWDVADLNVPAETDGGVYTIPRSDTVAWEGSVVEASGEYSGSIGVDLPPPFGEIQIDAWSGEYGDNSNFGEEEYDLPSLVPAGVEFEVHGQHTDDKGGCSGSITFEIDGGPFDSSITFIALGGTLFFFVGAGAALRPAFRRVS